MAYIRQSSPSRGEPIDPGLAAIREICRLWQVDERWSIREQRGFTWWAGDFRQRVSVDQGREDHGAFVYKLSAVTDLLTGIKPSEAGPIAQALLNRLGHRCYSLMIDERSRTASLAASVVFHRETANWVVPHFAALALLQVIQAQNEASTYLSILGGTPTFTGHPDAGVRHKHDEMLQAVNDVYLPAGEEPSRWAGSGEFEEVYHLLRQANCFSQADQNGLTAETAFGTDSALIRATASELHGLGHGLRLVLALPVALSDEHAAQLAVELNAAEARSFTASHSLGAWTIAEARGGQVLEFVSFVPNVLYQRGLLFNLILSLGLKARWARTEIAPYASDERDKNNRV